ncbi:MAG: hypothetical protein RI894_1820, partial [Bacteroidota bacterium]
RGYRSRESGTIKSGIKKRQEKGGKN